MTRNLDPLYVFIGLHPTGVKTAQVADLIGMRTESALTHLRRMRARGLLVRVGNGPLSRWTTTENAQTTRDWFRAQLKPPELPRKVPPQKPVVRLIPARTAAPLGPLGASSVFNWRPGKPSEGTKE